MHRLFLSLTTIVTLAPLVLPWKAGGQTLIVCHNGSVHGLDRHPVSNLTHSIYTQKKIILTYANKHSASSKAACAGCRPLNQTLHQKSSYAR